MNICFHADSLGKKFKEYLENLNTIYTNIHIHRIYNFDRLNNHFDRLLIKMFFG